MMLLLMMLLLWAEKNQLMMPVLSAEIGLVMYERGLILQLYLCRCR